MSAILGSILRHILTIYGGAVAAGGEADIGALFVRLVEGLVSGDSSALAGAAVALAVVAWSIYDKKSRLPKPQPKENP